MKDLVRTVEALLFLSPDPLAVETMAEACQTGEGEVVEALSRLREHYAEGWRGVVLREVAGGFALATDPVAEPAARRLFARPRTPPLSQAQAECLAVVAYLQPVSRPEVARIRGVASESRGRHAARARPGRGVWTLPLRRRALPHDGALRAAVRALRTRPAPEPRTLRPLSRGGGRAARAAAPSRRTAL